MDWFAFERILIYVTIRHLRPATLLETGVFYGGNTLFMLAAVHRNRCGRLISVDYPASAMAADREGRHPLVGTTEDYTDEMSPGFIVPDYLKQTWQLVIGDSLRVIPTLAESFDYYIHDSEHSMDFFRKEAAAVWAKKAKSLFLVADDIDWSNGFSSFCCENRLVPFLFTDNGKDDLRIRGGCAWSSHPKNQDPAFVGELHHGGS